MGYLSPSELVPPVRAIMLRKVRDDDWRSLTKRRVHRRANWGCTHPQKRFDASHEHLIVLARLGSHGVQSRRKRLAVLDPGSGKEFIIRFLSEIGPELWRGYVMIVEIC